MTDDDAQVRPFGDFLREQSKGSTHEELSEALQTLVQAVLDTGKSGSLVLSIRVERMKGDRRAVSVSDAIKIKLPEHDRDPSLFYADKDNNLVRNDPNQLSFESLREVPSSPAADQAVADSKKAGKNA